ncbi:MAG: O-antigen ligase family protein [Armatimonadota bacterium]|nr:O-antigen ligase family protein [bacterium]
MVSAAMLLAALILAPMIGGGFGEFDYAILEVLVFGAVVAHFLTPKGRQTNFARVPGIAPLSVFLVLAVASTVYSEAIYPSLNQLLLIFACVSAYILAASLAKDSKKAAAIVTGTALSALAVCAAGIRNYAISTGGGAMFWESLLSTGEHMRLFGSFINPGYFSGFIVMALPLTLGVYLVTKRTVLAVLIGMAFVLETIALMLTGTKFGIMAAVLGLLVFFLLAIGTKSLKRSKFTRLLILSVFLIPLLAIFSKPVTSRITAAETGGSQVHSTTFRVFTWQATIDMIKANPWLGVGPGVYSIAYPRYTIAGPTKAAHQSYLQIASESGIAALLAFLVAILAIANRSMKGIVKRQTEQTEHDAKTQTSENQRLSWSDVVPFSGRPVMNCAIYGALAASVLRNMVDSDWYIIGIALPFWVMAGVLVSQTHASPVITIHSRKLKGMAIAACLILAVLSASFGLARRLTPVQMGSDETFSSSLKGYEMACKICPLNAEYHRELAKYLAADGDLAASKRQLDTSAKLAPTDASTYQVGGMIALANDNPKMAVSYFKNAVKCNPNSTNAIYKMSIAYGMLGDEKDQYQAIKRLIEIENSLYEQVKGAPELVDTTFAHAHAYLGAKYMARKRYSAAANEYVQVIERLQRWQSNKDVLRVALLTGMLTESEKNDLLELLRQSRSDLAKCHNAR